MKAIKPAAIGLALLALAACLPQAAPEGVPPENRMPLPTETVALVATRRAAGDCELISPAEFGAQARGESDRFMPTREKLGLGAGKPGVLENLVLATIEASPAWQAAHVASRVYEFAWTDDVRGEYMQLHTTLSAYDPIPAAELGPGRGTLVGHVELDCVGRVAVYQTFEDLEQTAVLRFVVGDYLAVLKTKYATPERAVDLLGRMGAVVVGDLANGTTEAQ